MDNNHIVLLVTKGGSGISLACAIAYLKKSSQNWVTFVDRKIEEKIKNKKQNNLGLKEFFFMSAMLGTKINYMRHLTKLL